MTKSNCDRGGGVAKLNLETYNSEQMRMPHVYQPVMIKELLLPDSL